MGTGKYLAVYLLVARPSAVADANKFWLERPHFHDEHPSTTCCSQRPPSHNSSYVASDINDGFDFYPGCCIFLFLFSFGLCLCSPADDDPSSFFFVFFFCFFLPSWPGLTVPGLQCKLGMSLGTDVASNVATI